MISTIPLMKIHRLLKKMWKKQKKRSRNQPQQQNRDGVRKQLP
jgi:hypothetical protein